MLVREGQLLCRSETEFRIVRSQTGVWERGQSSRRSQTEVWERGQKGRRSQKVACVPKLEFENEGKFGHEGRAGLRCAIPNRISGTSRSPFRFSLPCRHLADIDKL